jgi:hypothetical protein
LAPFRVLEPSQVSRLAYDLYGIVIMTRCGGSTMLPSPPPTLKGKEAEAFLKDAAEPPTEANKRLVDEALRLFPK